MTVIERRAYTENVAAQEAAYWYCREHGIRANDLDIGQILQVAGPIILQGAVSREHAAQAIGWLSAEVAVHGAPSLGPEWLELWERALTATGGQ
jgi:hypothetical protein